MLMTLPGHTKDSINGSSVNKCSSAFLFHACERHRGHKKRERNGLCLCESYNKDTGCRKSVGLVHKRGNMLIVGLLGVMVRY